MAWPETYGEPATALSYALADTTLYAAGYEAGGQAECQLGNGPNVFAATPSTCTNFGFVDTTYLPNTAQILAETTQGVS